LKEQKGSERKKRKNFFNTGEKKKKKPKIGEKLKI